MTVSAIRDRHVTLGCLVLLLIGMPVAYLASSPSVTAMVIVLVLSLVVMLSIMRWLVPSERAAGRAGRTALILGVAAAVFTLVFWTGLPIALGAGAIALGLSATNGPGRVGLGLGLLAALASFALLLLG
jgi:hypothetical protein